MKVAAPLLAGDRAPEPGADQAKPDRFRAPAVPTTRATPRIVRDYERGFRHAKRRVLILPCVLCGQEAPARSGALRPTAVGAAVLTEVGSATVRSQVTVQPALFMRKSSV
jgi:hypothetical protein